MHRHDVFVDKARTYQAVHKSGAAKCDNRLPRLLFQLSDPFGKIAVEDPCFGRFADVKARFAMLGAAVFSYELAGLLRSTVDLDRLKLRATGRG